MNRLLGLPVVLLLLSCSGGDKGGDDRQFGSLSASFSSRTSGDYSSDAVVVEPSDDAILGKDIDGGAIDALGKSQVPIDSQGAGKGAEVGKGGTQPETKPVTPPAKTPDLPDDLKAKLAKCYPQWDKGAAGASYDIRQVNVDVDKLKASNIQLTGDKAEVVFVNIASSSVIEKVSLALENKKGLYCLDISADKGIKYLDINYVCGAKLGLVEIEGGKAKKVNIKEVCDQP